MLFYRPMVDTPTTRRIFWIPLALAILLNACATRPVQDPELNDQTSEEHLVLPAETRANSKPHVEPRFKQHTEQDLKKDRLSTRPANVEANREGDLWERLRSGFELPATYDQPRVKQYLSWHHEHPNYLRRITRRAQPFFYFIVEQLKRRGMPYDLALLPAVESGYMPLAFSQGRAAGLWQFIPETGRHYGLKQNWWYDGRRDIYASTHAALDYLSSLNRRFDGDWLLTLAAYNAGPLRVLKAIGRNRRVGKATDYWHLALPRETRNYVPKLLAIRAIVENPKAHGIELWPIADSPVITKVDTGAQIELALAAEMAVMDLDELYNLNAGFNRWATAPDGPHRLMLPIEKVARFRQRLDKLPPEHRVVWFRHKIKTGDTLEGIARKYHTSVNHILHANELPSTRIVAGKHLLVPKRTFHDDVIASRTLGHEQTFSSRGQRRHHTIRRGETLWSISRRHDVSLQELIDWNQLTPNEILIVGDRLVIKQPSTTNHHTSPTQTSRAQSGQRYIRTISYSVKAGDSLYGISRRFNVSVADLMRWNNFPDARLLRPGQTVKVRVDLTRQSSDS